MDQGDDFAWSGRSLGIVASLTSGVLRYSSSASLMNRFTRGFSANAGGIDGPWYLKILFLPWQFSGPPIAAHDACLPFRTVRAIQYSLKTSFCLAASPVTRHR